MNKRLWKGLALSLVIAITLNSCEKSEAPMEQTLIENAKISKSKVGLDDLVFKTSNKSEVPQSSENLGEFFRNAVEPSECGTTALNVVQNKYINAIISDPLALSYNGLYSDLNLYYSFLLDNSTQYFGEDGDYTQLMNKRQRELEKFWSMPVEITVQGQHTATLNNKDAVAEVFYNFFGFTGTDGEFIPLTQEQAYQQAEFILSLNNESPNLPENPYFASDGFASTNRTIVIGDGLPDWLGEAGIDEGIVWTGILAHEWSHQIQFLKTNEWYPMGAADNAPEASRYTELEADFFAAYFMTHKRGATYNWKRVKEFYNLFFQIGDCYFTDDIHHGTPLQRLAAAQAGYDLANDAQKKGHILSMDAVHEAFMNSFDQIVE